MTNIIKKPFRKYNLNASADKPMPVKLNEAEKEMIDLGCYMLNMHSRSGAIKILADIGLKVLLADFGIDRIHYLTNGERRRIIQNKPKIKHYQEFVQP